jgi:hypothetical protein
VAWVSRNHINLCGFVTPTPRSPIKKQASGSAGLFPSTAWQGPGLTEYPLPKHRGLEGSLAALIQYKDREAEAMPADAQGSFRGLGLG